MQLTLAHTFSRLSRARARGLLLLAAAASLLGVAARSDTANAADNDEQAAGGAVYAMSNEAAANEVIAYQRGRRGGLDLIGRFATGGEGTGMTRLSSQNPVILNDDGTRLYVVNVDSDDISVFRVRENASLARIDLIGSRGDEPYSVTLSPDGKRLYALNNGGEGAGNISGFKVDDEGELSPLSGSTRPLSGVATDPAQVSFTPDGDNLVVTEKETNLIDTYEVDRHGRASGPSIHESAGETPFGFDFTREGVFLVSEAFDGLPGQAATSSYVIDGSQSLRTISGSVRDAQAEVCWTVITNNDRFAYVTNFGNGTITSYEISGDGSIEVHDPVAGFTTLGELSVRDHGLSDNGRYLYAIDILSQQVHAWKVNQRNGDLEEIGEFPGLPPTVAGLASK